MRWACSELLVLAGEGQGAGPGAGALIWAQPPGDGEVGWGRAQSEMSSRTGLRIGDQTGVTTAAKVSLR